MPKIKRGGWNYRIRPDRLRKNNVSSYHLPWYACVKHLDNVLAGCSKRPSSKAAADESTGVVASGYVEDAFEARTTLADFFSILL
jgi:hypothetical protein